jgi:hypothetical protein
MANCFLRIFIGLLVFGSLGCTGKHLKYEKEDQLQQNEEFEQRVKIVEVPLDTGATGSSAAGDSGGVSQGADKGPKKGEGTGARKDETKVLIEEKKNKKAKKSKKTKQSEGPALSAGVPAADVSPTQREPDLEDSQGFNGQRRPLVNPFRVGEEVVHKVYYDSHVVNFSAGTLSLKVDPIVEVNGRKSYQFLTSVKSSPWFSSYYAVDDIAVTLMDYDLLIPRVFTLHIKESGQLREVRSFFDFDQNKATYWEKKVTEKSGIEEKKLQWDILPYSQNVFSAIYYLRIFRWEVGREYSFRVSDEAENLVFKAKALLRETLQTELGPKVAIKIKPEFTVKGAFKPVGDIYIWISDDDRKMVLRIECKIKIGSLVSEVTSITP